jgi:hypothetical protein
LSELKKIFEGYIPPKFVEDSTLLAEISEFNPSSKWIEIDSGYSYRRTNTGKQNSFDSVYCLIIGYYDSNAKFNF